MFPPTPQPPPTPIPLLWLCVCCYLLRMPPLDGGPSFATSYPDPDHMRVVAKETATTSLALLKTFNGRVESTTSQHKLMEALVRGYLTEIAAVEKQIDPHDGARGQGGTRHVRQEAGSPAGQDGYRAG